MKLLRAADHHRMPWRNGGGETLEIAVSPAGAGMEAFDWRVSMAAVAADGPFSLFPGIDRTLVLLEGDGMTLDIAGRGDIALTSRSAPCAFPGDLATAATLMGGPITDLNVMTRRGRHIHAVERLSAPRYLRAGPRETLFLVGAGVTARTIADVITLGARDVILLDAEAGAHAEWPAAATCLLVTIRPIG